MFTFSVLQSVSSRRATQCSPSKRHRQRPHKPVHHDSVAASTRKPPKWHPQRIHHPVRHVYSCLSSYSNSKASASSYFTLISLPIVRSMFLFSILFPGQHQYDLFSPSCSKFFFLTAGFVGTFDCIVLFQGYSWIRALQGYFLAVSDDSEMDFLFTYLYISSVHH